MLKIFEKAPEPYNDYVVASVGYENRCDAYMDIKSFHKGEDATTIFDKEENKWHVILKRR